MLAMASTLVAMASNLILFCTRHFRASNFSGDTDKIVPKNTYGMTKACGELLVNDYTRTFDRNYLRVLL